MSRMSRMRIGIVLIAMLISSSAFSSAKFKGFDECILNYKFTRSDSNYVGYLNLKSVDEFLVYKAYIELVFGSNKTRIWTDDNDLKQSVLERYLSCVQ